MYFSEWRKLQEEMNKKQFEDVIRKFLPFAKEFLKIKNLPEIEFIEKPSFSKNIASFGEIIDDHIVINIRNRHPMDVIRTVAHELVHYKQYVNGKRGSGLAGSSTENEANKLAGTLVRKFGETHSNYFRLSAILEAKKRKKKSLHTDYDHYPMELT